MPHRPGEVSIPVYSSSDYAAAARTAGSRQRRHLGSTVKWGIGLFVLHVVAPHVAIATDIALIGTLVRGGQTVVDTVDRSAYNAEATRLQAVEAAAVERYRRQVSPAPAVHR